jgi:hypothetical protein
VARRVGRRAREGRAGAAEVVATVLKKYGCAREMREHRVAMRWREIVGDLVASRAWPDGLDKGVLWIRVRTSTWVHQLSFLKAEIVERANRVVGDPPLVREVRFHLGPRERVSPDDVLAMTARIHRPPAEQRQPPAPAAGDRMRDIEREAASVSDAELRRLIVEVRRRWDL